MTIDERLEALTQTVELMAQMHEDHKRENAENLAMLTAKSAMLTERSAEFMDTFNRLGRIIEMHEHRLDSHDDRLDRLEDEQ